MRDFAFFWDNSLLIQIDTEGSKKTWGGDAYCAQLEGKPISQPLNLDFALVLRGSVGDDVNARCDVGDAEYNPLTVSIQN